MSEIQVFRLSELPRQALYGGSFERTALVGDQSLVTINWLRPDFPKNPPHNHPFDQLSFVFEGTMILQVDGSDYELTPGSALWIPANVPHTAWVKGTDTVLNVDVYAPRRQDYLFLAEHQIGSSSV